jgi:hypothetical protein
LGLQGLLMLQKEELKATPDKILLLASALVVLKKKLGAGPSHRARN